MKGQELAQQKEKCSLCDSMALIYDAEKSETVCSGCGMVLHDRIETLSSEQLPYSNYDIIDRTVEPTQPAFHGIGLSTFISYSKVDANGATISPEQLNRVNRMRKWNKISNNNRSDYRNLKNAFAILGTIKDKLSLSNAVMEKSAYNYRKALEKHITKGRSIRALVVASVYAACRELGVPRTLDEIARTINTDSIFAAKCYRLLVRDMKLHLPVMDSSSCLAKIANKAGISETTYRRGLEVLSLIKDNTISYGKDPNALAVTALYIACIKQGEKISQTRIANAGGTSVVTLRKRIQDMTKLFLNKDRNIRID